MLVAVYYHTYICIGLLDSISVSLTGIPVLHTVSTRCIAVGRDYKLNHYACIASWALSL